MTRTPLLLSHGLLCTCLALFAACGGDDGGEGDATADDGAGDDGAGDDGAGDDDGGTQPDAGPGSPDAALSCAETCDGCCDGETCVSGNSADQCGGGGEACTACGPDFVCADALCVVDPASRWDVLAVRGQAFEDNLGGGSWDPFGGLPDTFVSMRTEDPPDAFTGGSANIGDTLTPVWDQVVLEDVPARALTGFGLDVEMVDDDGVGDDTMGRCRLLVGDEAFGEAEVTSQCATDENADPPSRGWSFTWRLRRR